MKNTYKSAATKRNEDRLLAAMVYYIQRRGTAQDLLEMALSVYFSNSGRTQRFLNMALSAYIDNGGTKQYALELVSSLPGPAGVGVSGKVVP